MVGRILLKLVCEGGKEYYVDYEDCFTFSKSMTADKLHDPSKLI